uniref:Uncharacterized protein n=1 Tax=Rhodnius prolixus TaxID=13249 RepID=T1HES5_RHOPR
MCDRFCENNGNGYKTDNSINDSTPVRQKLISTEPSPNKIFNCKIDEVHSPEIRKRRFSGQCPSQNRVKSRKKLKSRHSEPSKLSVRRVKIERRSQEVQSDCVVSGKCMKQTTSVQSDNIGIFCLPESGRRRRQKKYQPGSLLERLHVISSKVEKDKLLFSYEMEAGLRANTGQLVTCDLIVTSLTKHHVFQILHCKSTSKVCA